MQSIRPESIADGPASNIVNIIAAKTGNKEKRGKINVRKMKARDARGLPL